MGEWGSVPAVCDFTHLATVEVTANFGTAYSEGAWITLIDPTPFDIKYLWVHIKSPNVSLAQILIDIGIGAVGSEVVLLTNICDHHSNLYEEYRGYHFALNMQVKSGTRICARAQDNTGTSRCSPFLTISSARQGSYFPDAANIEAITVGVNNTNNAMTTIDPGETINTKGAYYELIASTPWDANGFIINTGIVNSTTTACAWWIDIAIGAADSEVDLFSNYMLFCHSGPDGIGIRQGPHIPIPIKAGTRISARALSGINDATDRLFLLALVLIR